MIDFDASMTKYAFRSKVCKKCKLSCNNIDFCYSMYDIIKGDFEFIYEAIQKKGKGLLDMHSSTALNTMCPACTLRNECLIENYDVICMKNIYKQLDSNSEGYGWNMWGYTNHGGYYYDNVATSFVSDDAMTDMFEEQL